MARLDSLRSVELGRVLMEASSPLRHDLRNRLGSIRNMAYFVGKRVKDCESVKRDPRVLEFLTLIESEVEKANELIDAWGERMAHVHERKVERVPARLLLDLAIASADLEEGVELHVDCEDGELEVDPFEAALALRCLIENAAEATGTGRVDVVAGPYGDEYRLRVRDRGPGIELNAKAEGAPEPRPGHLGLGLAIARRTADAAGGKLLVRRAPDCGTQAELVLPLGARSEQFADSAPANE